MNEMATATWQRRGISMMTAKAPDPPLALAIAYKIACRIQLLCIVMVITLLLPLQIRLKDTAQLSTLNVLIITHSTKLKEVDLSLNLKMAITSVKM